MTSELVARANIEAAIKHMKAAAMLLGKAKMDKLSGVMGSCAKDLEDALTPIEPDEPKSAVIISIETREKL